jgi:sugar lactone lactonase YvrE
MDFYECPQAVEVVVPAGGGVTEPSGMALYNQILYVTDHANARITAFGLDGSVINWLDTGLGAGGLGGIALAGSGVVYVIDRAGPRVLRIDP